MAVLRGLALVLSVTFTSCLILVPSLASSDGFLQCIRAKIPSELVYTQCNTNFTAVLASSIRNPKFFTNTTVRPLCVVTPTDASHVQAAVLCGRWQGVRLRVRSGGHDYEGLSCRSARPEVFGLLDLANLRAVSINQWDYTAWVDSGATIGELYYTIAKNNPEVAFPAGECPTIGVGGHFSGGGVGMMMRKYGLSIDNVLDAKLVNANGDLLDRAAMGEDLFWAIRGGGGVSTSESGKVWGERYFMSNYQRLASVKAAVDPMDYFRNEQSIPPLLPVPAYNDYNEDPSEQRFMPRDPIN